MIRIFFLSQSSPILELFPFDKITLKSYICTVVTVMAKQCWSQTVLESGSWGHSVLQTPALVFNVFFSEIAGAIFNRFHMGPSVERVLTICSNGSALMNKMVAMPIYGKKHLKIFSSTKKALRLNLGI